MVRILFIGMGGTIGTAAAAAISAAIPEVSLISGSRSSGATAAAAAAAAGGAAAATVAADNDVVIDISRTESIRDGLARWVNAASDADKLDHIVCTGGQALFKPLLSCTKADFEAAFKSKALGQIDLVLQGVRALKSTGGSITLTSGFLDTVQVPASIGTGAINAAINTFVRQAPAELPANVRLNVVSPGLVAESEAKYGPYFQGFPSVAAEDVARGYVRAILGGVTGKVIEVLPATQWREA